MGSGCANLKVPKIQNMMVEERGEGDTLSVTSVPGPGRFLFSISLEQSRVYAALSVKSEYARSIHMPWNGFS
jgi:hypothetical protein